MGLALIFGLLINQTACEGQMINNNAAPTEAQQIFGDRLIGQTFVASRGDMNRLDLMFLTYGRHNTPEVTLRLLEVPANSANPLEGHEIFRTHFQADTIGDHDWHSFELPPIGQSAQQTYLFLLESPQAESGNAITVGGIERDVYLPGSAFFGPVPVRADIAFRVCYQTSLVEKIQILAGQITRAKPGIFGSFSLYIMGVMLYLGLMGLLFWRLERLKW